VVAYADDGYIKGKLSVTLQVLVELKCVLKEDVGMDLNVSKTSVLPKDVTQQSVFDDTLIVRNFVDKTCGAIIDDVEKIDVIQDGFIYTLPVT
jgi:hypothetical protein